MCFSFSRRATHDADIAASAATALRSAVEGDELGARRDPADNAAVTDGVAPLEAAETPGPSAHSEWVRCFRSEMDALRAAHAGTRAEEPLSWLARHGREAAHLLQPLQAPL